MVRSNSTFAPAQHGHFLYTCTSVSSQVNKADTAWFSSTHSKEGFFTRSKSSESSTHYLNDTIRFNVSSKGPSSGINVGGRGQARVFLYMQVY